MSTPITTVGTGGGGVLGAPAVLPTPLPFGMRDVKIYPYLDAQGTILADKGFDLPHAQTFSFADAEEFVDLRGDDELVATHGNGAQVNWTLEAGGINLACWAIFTGGQIIEEGVAPNRTVTLRKCSDDTRPYFMVVGQIMSDSGGSVTGVVYRAKCNADISGSFADGAFFVTAANGLGLPIPGTKLLYDLKQSEARTFLSLKPKKIPVLPPKNAGTTDISTDTVSLIWEPVTGVTKYVVKYSDNEGETWRTEETEENEFTVEGLTPGTAYIFQVASQIGTETSYFGKTVYAATLAEDEEAPAPVSPGLPGLGGDGDGDGEEEEEI